MTEATDRGGNPLPARAKAVIQPHKKRKAISTPRLLRELLAIIDRADGLSTDSTIENLVDALEDEIVSEAMEATE